MYNDIVSKELDMRIDSWSYTKESSGTAGIFLKTNRIINGTKYYFKLSNFNSAQGFFGHESALEILAQRVIDRLGYKHVVYRLIPVHHTYAACSKACRLPGERRVALEQYCASWQGSRD